MMEFGCLIPASALASFSPQAREEILAYIGRELKTGPSDAAKPAAVSVSSGEDGPAELTQAFARKLTKNLSEKTLNALKVISQGSSREFRLKDIIDATDGAETYMDMRGVWSGLTRRTRSILNDSDADLIWWRDDGDGDENDWVGEVSQMTYESLKAYFAS